jgi:hypothetical protein
MKSLILYVAEEKYIHVLTHPKWCEGKDENHEA